VGPVTCYEVGANTSTTTVECGADTVAGVLVGDTTQNVTIDGSTGANVTCGACADATVGEDGADGNCAGGPSDVATVGEPDVNLTAKAAILGEGVVDERQLVAVP